MIKCDAHLKRTKAMWKGWVKESNKRKVTKETTPHNSRNTFKHKYKKQWDKIITLFSYLWQRDRLWVHSTFCAVSLLSDNTLWQRLFTTAVIYMLEMNWLESWAQCDTDGALEPLVRKELAGQCSDKKKRNPQARSLKARFWLMPKDYPHNIKLASSGTV